MANQTREKTPYRIYGEWGTALVGTDAQLREMEAASELLKACKAMLIAGEKLVGYDDYVKQFGFSQECATENALAAIAKAEGK